MAAPIISPILLVPAIIARLVRVDSGLSDGNS